MDGPLQNDDPLIKSRESPLPRVFIRFLINEPVLHGPVHALQNESKSITTRFTALGGSLFF